MLGRPAQLHPGPAAGQPRRARPRSSSARAPSSARRRRASRRSASRYRGRRSSRPCRRPTASRRAGSTPPVSIRSFSGRTTAWQREPVGMPSVFAWTSTPVSSLITPVGADASRHQVRDADEPGDEGRRRPLVDALGLVDLLDLAAVHHRDPVRHRQRLLLVVRHVDERDADLPLDALQLDLQALAELQVERAERLVEQEDLRQVDQGAGERDPLLLAAGELAGLAVRSPRPGRPARAPPSRGPSIWSFGTFLRRSPKATFSANG